MLNEMGSMKNSGKAGNSFPRPLRDSGFGNQNFSGAQMKKENRRGSAFIGFMIFSVWNFLTLFALFALLQWSVSALRTLGVAVLLALWQSVLFGVSHALRNKE